MKQKLMIVAAALPLLAAPATAGEWDFGAEVAGEVRLFSRDPLFPGQLEGAQPSVSLTGDVRWSSDDGRHSLVFIPFARIDGEDDERSHGDIREGYYRYAGDEVELLVGAAKIFWGTTESRHLVDIINQTDAVEAIDGEDKLGQPMVKLSFLKEWGTLDFFVLPGFREQTFPGTEGRLRFDPVVDTDAVQFADDDGRNTPDVAVRYSHYFGDWDVGVSAFSGTSREPSFAPIFREGEVRLAPRYDEITQLGVDAQYTKDAWLLKFEGILRDGEDDDFGAFVAGVEYTFFGVTESGADFGVLAEYLSDDRDPGLSPPTPFENDLFVGGRFARNDIQDTSVLFGAISDLDDGTVSALVEAERRLGQNWKAEVEARFIPDVDQANLLYPLRRDDTLSFRLTRYY